MRDLIFALGVVLVAVVAWLCGRSYGSDAAYREGRRDGWNEAVDRFAPKRPQMGGAIGSRLPPRRGQTS